MEFSCQHLSKEFRTRRGQVVALADVTFSVREHEFVCIVGPSGCGKTTLLKIIAGLIKPTGGRLDSPQAPSSRPRNALVFQEHGLYPWMSVLDNVAFGLEMQGMVRRERENRAYAFIEKLGLAAFSRNYPHELSVGMRQRVGIARAFVSDPQMLLMDEPFGSLDAQTRRVLQDELLRISKEESKSVVFVTHDIDEAVLLGDRVLVMSERPGRIVEDFTIASPRPRNQADDGNLTEIKWRIWRMLEADVRKNLYIPLADR